jgi:hypothetical protein
MVIQLKLEARTLRLKAKAAEDVAEAEEAAEVAEVV